MADRKTERRNDFIVYVCMAVCMVLSGITGWLAGMHYGQEATRQNARLAAQNIRLLSQERLTCKALFSIQYLLQGSLERSRRAVKVDPLDRRPIDRAAIKQLMVLVEGIEPATKFCT